MNRVPFLSLDPLHEQLRDEMLSAFERFYDSGRYILADHVAAFEQAYAEFSGTRFCVGVGSGFDALRLSLDALGIGKGDEVIVPSNTFIATWLAVTRTGAEVVPVEPDPRTANIDPTRIADAVGKRTRAVVPVHLHGRPCEMDAVMSVADGHGIAVIEDNAQAQGASYRGRPTGSFGRINATSFYPTKIIGALGDAGAVTTDDEEVAWRCRSFRDHGYDVRERLRLLEMEQKLPYIHTMVGWNYRMTEMQSVIGLCELERIDSWNIPRRRRNAGILLHSLRDVPQILHLPVDTPERRNGWYVFPITLAMERMDCDMETFLAALGAEGAPCWKVFWPQCHTEQAFREHRSFGRSGFPFRSEEYSEPASVAYGEVDVPNAVWHQARTFITFVFPTYEEEHMQGIAAAIRKVVAAYAK